MEFFSAPKPWQWPTVLSSLKFYVKTLHFMPAFSYLLRSKIVVRALKENIKMYLDRNEKSLLFHCIFFVTVFQIIGNFFFLLFWKLTLKVNHLLLHLVLKIQSVDTCYADQYCLTLRNYSGRYVEEENYEYIADKTLCDGFCHHNSTSKRLRCCAYDANVKLERISEQSRASVCVCVLYWVVKFLCV